MQSSMNDDTGAKIRSHPKQAFENKMYIVQQSRGKY
jgi:hypothetical protein